MIEKVLVNRVEPPHHELSTFVDCGRENRPFPTPLEEGAANIEAGERYVAISSNLSSESPAERIILFQPPLFFSISEDCPCR